MIAIERHIAEAKETSVCVFTESKGGLGGARLVWQVASCLEKTISRTASFVVVPQLNSVPDSQPKYLSAGTRTSNVGHGELTANGLAGSVLKAASKDWQNAPNVNLRVLVIENATALVLSHGISSVIALLRECKASPAVHSVLALFQDQAHAAAEWSAIRSAQTCNVLLQPVRPLLGDMIHTSHGQRVHVEVVVTLLRHSGMPGPTSTFVCKPSISYANITAAHE